MPARRRRPPLRRRRHAHRPQRRPAPPAHGRDADAIVGDNGDILPARGRQRRRRRRHLPGLHATTTPTASARLLPRAVKLLDYTPGGPDLRPDAVPGDDARPRRDDGARTVDVWGADEIHGEAGDDTVYAGGGNDVLFGDGQDDDLIGGWGNDWISGGTGRTASWATTAGSSPAATARRAAQRRRPATTPARAIATPGTPRPRPSTRRAKLNKTVDLTPFNLNPDHGRTSDDPLFRPAVRRRRHLRRPGQRLPPRRLRRRRDLRRRGAGRVLRRRYDANPRPASARRTDLTARSTPATLLQRYRRRRAGQFALYDEYDPRRRITLNANGTANKASATCRTSRARPDHAAAEQWLAEQRRDRRRLRGDTGICIRRRRRASSATTATTGWSAAPAATRCGAAGATTCSTPTTTYHATATSTTTPDTHTTYEDRAFGGAGLDVLIANTGGDRLIDWVGEFNTYLVPFSPFGIGTVSRQVPPGLMEFLYALSKAQGADPTLARQTGAGSEPRNGEPFGELGDRAQQDAAWQDQTGGPRDPQAGNSPRRQARRAPRGRLQRRLDRRVLRSTAARWTGQQRCAEVSAPPASARTRPRSSTSTRTCRCTTSSPRRSWRRSRPPAGRPTPTSSSTTSARPTSSSPASTSPRTRS